MDRSARIEKIATDARRYTVDPVTQCWVWCGAKLRSGHAVVKLCRKLEMAYRLFYIFYVGPIGPGRHIHHQCENPMCVNPAHLQAVTPGDHARLHAKLSFAIAADIRSLSGTGELSQADLAARYGVDQTTISAVLRNRTWRVADS